jgi:hypothetical protein
VVVKVVQILLEPQEVLVVVDQTQPMLVELVWPVKAMLVEQAPKIPTSLATVVAVGVLDQPDIMETQALLLAVMVVKELLVP